MNEVGRIPGSLGDLDRILDDANTLAARGRHAYDTDAALPLAFEALCNRVGDLAKKLVAADPELFVDPAWNQAARNRDFVVHQYHRVDTEMLWNTVTVSFPHLHSLTVEAQRTLDSPPSP